MKQGTEKSSCFSQIAVAMAALLLLALDVACPWWAPAFARVRGLKAGSGALLMASFYTCSVFGWITLSRLWRLLSNLRRGEVFTEQNVACLRCISGCCAAAAGVSLLSCLYYLPFAVLFLAAGFMTLIVRVVKNVFEVAVGMKSELDLTI